MSRMFTPKEEERLGTFGPFFLTYLLSLVLTLAAYFAVTQHLLSQGALRLLVAFCGLSQVIAQLLFFLHLGVESKPRWNFIVFLFTLLVAFIVIAGSIWIMNSLDYRMM